MPDFEKQRMGDYASITVGGTPSTAIPSYWGGEIPWMASGDVHKKRIKDVEGRITQKGLQCSNATMVLAPAVAVALAGQGKTRGTAALTEIEICTNQSVALIKTKETFLNSTYLFHLLTHEYEDLRTASAGGGRAGLSKGILENYDIGFPVIEEQKAIAMVLDTVDEAIQSTQAMLDKQDKIKQGLLHDLLTRGVDERGHLRPSPETAPDLYQQTEIGLIPKKWEAGCLGTMISALDSGVSVNSSDHEKGPGEIGILKTSCVNGGIFNPKEHKTVISVEKNRVRMPVRGNSIIISRMNTPALVGENAYVPEDCGDLFLPDRLWITQMNVNRNTSVKWLSYVLQSKHLREAISSLATGTSGSMKNISKGSLLGIGISIPQHDEQIRIEKFITSYADTHAELGRELKKLQNLKSGLMQDLLTGRKRVTPALMRDVEKLAEAA